MITLLVGEVVLAQGSLSFQHKKLEYLLEVFRAQLMQINALLQALDVPAEPLLRGKGNFSDFLSRDSFVDPK